MDNNVAGITPLGHNGDPVGTLGDIIGQVDSAIAIPDEWSTCFTFFAMNGSFMKGIVPARKPITTSTLFQTTGVLPPLEFSRYMLASIYTSACFLMK
jgi:hypothetical protein